MREIRQRSSYASNHIRSPPLSIHLYPPQEEFALIKQKSSQMNNPIIFINIMRQIFSFVNNWSSMFLRISESYNELQPCNFFSPRLW